jgi:quercetin dioxygenase-like cupin family protein
MTTSATSAVHHRWSDIPTEPINASIGRQFITGERVTVGRFEMKAGAVVPRHAHENEQVSCVLSGALRFHFDDRDVLVRSGEVMQIPPNVAHAVDVVEDCVVVDVFCPVRQDWLDKTDSYFRR